MEKICFTEIRKQPQVPFLMRKEGGLCLVSKLGSKTEKYTMFIRLLVQIRNRELTFSMHFRRKIALIKRGH
jgi:hypothetical protein